MQDSISPVCTPSPSVGLNPFQNSRIFLDVCSGSSRPLSTALKKHNVDVLSLDILLDLRLDLLDDSKLFEVGSVWLEPHKVLGDICFGCLWLKDLGLG